MPIEAHPSTILPLPSAPHTWLFPQVALAEHIRTVAQDVAMAARAAEMGRLMRAEDGVGTAVQLIEARMAKLAVNPLR
jgi:UDP:flavonoid glycosyltransferase YjiC (YdhE family)